MHKEHIEELSRCFTCKDVEMVFKKAAFPNRGKSNFFDDSIALVDSGNMITNLAVKVDGFGGLLFRLIVFLKFSGALGKIPANAGETSYFNQLQTLFFDLSVIKHISKIEDFDSELMDKYILMQFEKGNKARTTMIKINSMLEITYYEDDLKLPYFLRLSELRLKDSVEYEKLNKLSLIENRKSVMMTSAKEPYPMEQLKVLLGHSIEYTEKYSEEILEVSKLYVSTKEDYQYAKYSKTYDYFKETDLCFSEIRLKELHQKIKKSDTKYMHDGEKNRGRDSDIGKSREVLKDVIQELEIACISIALMMTGMRVGELCTLDRNLKIREDEHYSLERIVYKTANSEHGESLEMPIPKICKKALEVLSELSFIKDSKENSSLILSSISETEVKPIRTSRVNQLLIAYCKKLGLKDIIGPHQFRHSMAFLIVHINEGEGLELARMFLGHTSIVMTLQYMGNYNNQIKDAVQELQKEESEQLVESIVEQIQNNKKLFGENGKRLMPSNSFVGRQVDEFVKLMREGLTSLIEEEKLAIIQTPVSLCFHDLSKPEDLACQRGFDIYEIASSGPAPSRCKGANCANALFFESHVEKLKNEMYAEVDPLLKERLERNTYFMDAGGFEQDPFRKIIKSYNEQKEEVSNG